jgi:hypothetical protein
MASTETVRVFSVSQPSVSLRWVEKYFYLCMSLLIAAVVVYGFSHTVENKLIHANPRPPILLWVHALLFSSWVAFTSHSQCWYESGRWNSTELSAGRGLHLVRPWSWSGPGWHW